MFEGFKSQFERWLPRSANTLKSIKEYYRGEPEIRLLKYIVPHNELAVDIGANKGVYTYWLKKYAIKVLAVEPNPDCVKFLNSAFDTGVEIINGACSAASGSARLKVPIVAGRINAYQGYLQSNDNYSDDSDSILVSTFMLDELVGEQVGFIKIDVEGHELDVLEGGRDTLERYRPTVLIEAEDRHRKGSVENVFTFFECLGYQCLFYYQGKILTGASFSLPLHQAIGNLGPGARGSAYVNNFLFLPQEKIELIQKLQRIGSTRD